MGNNDTTTQGEITMESWVITYNDNRDSLFADYETIEGKNAMDALKRRFNKTFQRLTGDAGRYASIILVKGYFKDNTIYHTGRYQMLCYTEVQP